MKNYIKIIFISVFSLIISFSYSYASSGVFKVSHDLGFGKYTNWILLQKAAYSKL